MSTWSELETSLTAAIAGLADDAWVTLEAPPREAAVPPADDAPAGGRLRRLFGGGKGAAPGGIVLQLRRQGTYLYGECTGGPAVGGDFGWTDAEHTALLGLGWGTPPHIGARVYLRHFPGDDGPPPAEYLEDGLADEAVTLVVRTLRDVYGLTAPETVTLTWP
ncbi:hypothetical protein V2J56_01570 [Georgenia sp. MJ206]|uniref:TY-Chap domain-containing protein n=1 Tax=Georgenia wangjunii TaxID=3117730 RepID=UPI002F267248